MRSGLVLCGLQPFGQRVFLDRYFALNIISWPFSGAHDRHTATGTLRSCCGGWCPTPSTIKPTSWSTTSSWRGWPIRKLILNRRLLGLVDSWGGLLTRGLCRSGLLCGRLSRRGLLCGRLGRRGLLRRRRQSRRRLLSGSGGGHRRSWPGTRALHFQNFGFQLLYFCLRSHQLSILQPAFGLLFNPAPLNGLFNLLLVTLFPFNLRGSNHLCHFGSSRDRICDSGLELLLVFSTKAFLQGLELVGMLPFDFVGGDCRWWFLVLRN